MDKESFQHEIQLTASDKKAGFEYSKLKMHFFNKGPNENNDFVFYVRAKENETKITVRELHEHLKADWKSFDDFANGFNSFYQITFNQDAGNWKKSACTCPMFGNNFMCKHIVAMAYRLELILPEINPDEIPLAPKKKPGRPKKATKGLSKG